MSIPVNPINPKNMEVHIPVKAGAKPVNESHCTDVRRGLVHVRRTRAMNLQALRYDPQKDAQHYVENSPVTLHEIAQPLGVQLLAHADKTTESRAGQRSRTSAKRPDG